jgi:hypothetical protein
MKKLKRLFLNKNARRISCLTAAGAGLAASGSQAQAQTIIYDNFSSASGTYGSTLNGAAVSTGGPNANLTGNNYINAGGYNNGDREFKRSGQNPGNYPGLSVAPANYAAFDPTGGAAIVLGAYNTGSLTVTGDILGYAKGYNEGGAPNTTNAYSLVGFTTRTTAAGNYAGHSPIEFFTGLEATGSGALQYYVDGTAVGTAAAYGGTYSSISPAVLSYTINTATGAISNVSFGASTTSYYFAPPGSWSSADTAAGVIGGTGGASNSQAQIGYWSIAEASSSSSVPEPSTYALLVSGAAALGALQLRRRYRA